MSVYQSETARDRWESDPPARRQRESSPEETNQYGWVLLQYLFYGQPLHIRMARLTLRNLTAVCEWRQPGPGLLFTGRQLRETASAKWGGGWWWSWWWWWWGGGGWWWVRESFDYQSRISRNLTALADRSFPQTPTLMRIIMRLRNIKRTPVMMEFVFKYVLLSF